MRQETLVERIDQLAKTKAMAWAHSVLNAVQAALEPYWWLDKKYGRQHQGDVIKQILDEYMVTIGVNRNMRWSGIDLSAVEKEFRQTILDEVLDKLPLVQELVGLRESLPPAATPASAPERPVGDGTPF